MTTHSTTGYPFAVVQLEQNWSAGALQWQAALTAPSRDELDRLMAQQVALHLYDCELEGINRAGPKPASQLPLDRYRNSEHPFDVIYIDPAPLNAFAVAIENAMREQGISQAELARRMNVPASVVSRITDPLCFEHTSETLRVVAVALGRDIHVSL